MLLIALFLYRSSSGSLVRSSRSTGNACLQLAGMDLGLRVAGSVDSVSATIQQYYGTLMS